MSQNHPVREYFTSLLMICYLVSACSAMGTAPSKTEEIKVPVIVFTRTIGGIGLGDGRFINPTDVCVDPNAGTSAGAPSIFVCDHGNNRVQVFDKDWNFIRKFGSVGNLPGFFYDPWSIAVDRSSMVYVSDSGNSRVQKFTVDGRSVSAFGAQGFQPGKLKAPTGITIGRMNDVLVADTGNHRIEDFDMSGSYISSRGIYGVALGSFNLPQDVAVDRDNNIYVVDTRNHRVQIFYETVDTIDRIGKEGLKEGEFIEPKGIAVDENYIYVCDTGNNRVQVFSRVPVFGRVGKYLTSFGTYQMGEGRLSGPTGITVTSDGRIFVADTNNNRIQEYKLTFSANR